MTAACIQVVCNESGRPEISIDRPVHAARVFSGRSPDEVLRLLPLLFGVCGTAQAVAGVHAMRAALGKSPDVSLTAAHGALVRFEVAREHLWRILLDWPRFTRYRPPARALETMKSLLPRARAALFDGDPFQLAPVVNHRQAAIDAICGDLRATLEEDVLGAGLDEWLAIQSVGSLLEYVGNRDGAAPRLFALLLAKGWQGACRSTPEQLPALAAAAIEGVLANGSADRFVEAPDWAGIARETSALTRQRAHPLIQAVTAEYGVGLLARALAAVHELAATPKAITGILAGIGDPGIEAERTAANTGVAQVEAARGRLVHRVVSAPDVVSDYRIVAPTEWNFHATGSVAEGLTGLPADGGDDGRLQADLFLTLMDPCVGWSLELH
jgi:hypothetical protein